MNAPDHVVVAVLLLVSQMATGPCMMVWVAHCSVVDSIPDGHVPMYHGLRGALQALCKQLPCKGHLLTHLAGEVARLLVLHKHPKCEEMAPWGTGDADARQARQGLQPPHPPSRDSTHTTRWGYKHAPPLDDSAHWPRLASACTTNQSRMTGDLLSAPSGGQHAARGPRHNRARVGTGAGWPGCLHAAPIASAEMPMRATASFAQRTPLPIEPPPMTSGGWRVDESTRGECCRRQGEPFLPRKSALPARGASADPQRESRRQREVGELGTGPVWSVCDGRPRGSCGGREGGGGDAAGVRCCEGEVLQD